MDESGETRPTLRLSIVTNGQRVLTTVNLKMLIIIQGLRESKHGFAVFKNKHILAQSLAVTMFLCGLMEIDRQQIARASRWTGASEMGSVSG